MLRYIIQRLLQLIPILIGISVLTFLMLHLIPGDPVLIFAGDKPMTEERAAEIRHQLGLDRPLWVQYGDYAAHAVRGDLGRGLRSQRPVLDSILEVAPGTTQLTLAALALATILGMTLGILAALARGTWLDTAAMTFAILGVSMPVFYSSLLMILLFSFTLGWLPATGQGGVARLVMPATALGMISAAVLARLVRSGMLAVLRQEYVVTARAKGLAPRVVVLRHALKNALIPTITMLGLQLGALLGGAVVTETIFSRPGVGRLAVDAILSRDFPLVQGTVLFTAVAYVLVNLLVDISYAAIDPRVRYQ
ncbi:MAG: ABC transporter permease [Bacillati bacterium ANGP1]|uniref:ABC transporter permease n=1 Tax=Candidatus Segetimicrobium genomatis TaxID=2569760 RepID=A0A537JVS9_9BACT|nr:MAG: ABC transporter permease [Terrabacteria group bacterium ANGP1]